MSIVAKKNNFGLAFKLSALILVSTAAIFGIAFIYNFTVSKRLMLEDVKQNAGNLARATANRITIELHGIEMIPRFLALSLEERDPDQAELEGLVRDILKANPSVYGSTIAFEPHAFEESAEHFAPYAYREDDTINLTYIGDKDYQYHAMDWYAIPRELEEAAWSEPYFDEGGGNVTMSTYSVPFYRKVEGARRFMGVVTVDISLDWLQELAKEIHIFESGFVFILSQNGQFVYHPEDSVVMNESIFSLADTYEIAQWREVGRAMQRGEEDFTPIQGMYQAHPSWLYYAPLSSAQWSLGVIFRNDELFSGIHSLALNTVLIALFGFCMLFLLVVLVSTRITRPLRVLSHNTAEIAKGNLDHPMALVHSHDEVGALSHSFENMRSALKEYINDLTETTAAKERIESELKIAHRIQMSFLPRSFPPFPDHEEFSIHAMLDPAKEVGGDLYDFFLLEDGRLFFSIGDVTDKGVPAALFMAVTKTLMKGVALQGDFEPGSVLAAVNNELCPGNDTSMFVTLMCGCLNLETGELHYANAGHNPPVLVRKGAAPEWLELPKGLVLGVMPDRGYETRVMQMRPGDKILAYTDGVTEAMNIDKVMYSTDRLIEHVATCADLDSEAMVTQLMATVREFAGEAPQSDDITLLAIEYSGN